MNHEASERIKILNEKGILEKKGGAFHTPMEFAVENLFYVAWSSRYVCNNLYSVKRDYLDFYSVIWVLDGQMILFYEGKEYTVKKDEAVLLDFRKPHEYRADGNHLDKWEMVFKGNASQAFYERIASQWGNKFKVVGRLKETLKSLREELDSPFPKDDMISMQIHSIFCRIVDQKSVKLSPPIEEALAFMYANFQRPMQISEIAGHVALSRHYFSRRFMKETGRTPYEYLADIRINAAKEMLTEKALSVAEIAERCGFVNTSHFTRYFRSKTGQTPAAFRNFFNLKET